MEVGATLMEPMTDTGRRRGFLVVLAVSVFFVGATEFMLSAMLGPLATAFHTSLAGSNWLVSSYACSYAAAAPLFGFVSDRVDRVRLLLTALLLFAVDGTGIVLAPSIEVAMAFRVFGGMASAVLIPTAFALIAEIVERQRQADAMGIVMLGMTFGIALGPAMAGILTDWLGWRAPFLVTSSGCVIAFAFGLITMPRRPPGTRLAAKIRTGRFAKWSVLRPLLAKASWNGTGVSAFLLSGEILHRRYGFGATEIGLSVTAFGVGLGIGNLSAGALRRLFFREESSLVFITILLVSAISAFMLMPLPLAGSLTCLTCWGAAMGAGAPSSTVVLAARSGPDKGMVLAFAETFNNIAILAMLPLATARLLRAGAASAMNILILGLGLGLVLTVLDAALTCSGRASGRAAD